jgi:hypothetical protein
MSGFQQTINIYSAAGVQGNFYTTAPQTVAAYTIYSSDEDYNIVGATFCTITSSVNTTDSGICQAGGTGAPAGFLCGPNQQANYGLNNQPLTPTMTVNNYNAVQCATGGQLYVYLPDACDVGDWIVYNTTTGALLTITAGDSLPSGYGWTNSSVLVSISEAGVTAIQISPIIAQLN